MWARLPVAALPLVRVYARCVQPTRAASQTKFLLEESQLPRRWYKIRPDLPTAVAKTADEAGEEFAGELEDVALDEDEIDRALHVIEGLPTPA
jgi:hypothetical protein